MSCDCTRIFRWPTMTRRAALVAATGGGLGALLPAVQARAGGHCEALLLTCMDYRLANETAAYMDARGLRDKYDHVILAGASLGALNDRFPQWSDVFFGHVDLAVQLHEVHRIIILDHRDCGAYRMLKGEAAVKDAESELNTHVKQLYLVRSTILARHPHMEVEIGLMDLDGKVLQIV